MGEHERMGDDEREFLRRFASLPEAQRERIFEIATMPAEDWATIKSIPRKATFWLGVAAALGTLGGIIWAALGFVGPDKSMNAAAAAANAIGHHGGQ